MLTIKTSMLPLWLSPTQIRLIPVSVEKHGKYCEELASKISEQQVRVDIDDRDESVGKRIRGSGTEWVPYTLVIGNNELSNDKFVVRDRELNKEFNIDFDKLISLVKEKTYGMPFDTLPIPRSLNKRILFRS